MTTEPTNGTGAAAGAAGSDAGGSAAGGSGSSAAGNAGSSGAAGNGGNAGSGGNSGTGGAAGTAGSAGSSGVCAGKAGMAGDSTLTVMSGGEARKLLLHVPAGYDPTKPTQLVLSFHGYTDTAAKMANLTKLTEKSDEQGFVVAHPEGKAAFGLQAWNAGSCCGGADADDVGFTKDMIDAIAKDYCIDDQRIFAIGFSNGGMLSHRLACELSDRIAAIASGSGTIAVDSCSPTRPVPVLHMHGTSDQIVPYNGGAFAKSVADTISAWVKRNGCASPSVEIYKQGAVHCEEYAGCQEGANVELCTVDGGQHTWFGSNGMGDLVNTDRALEFFAAHPMQ